jgi:hypothetical protein
LTLPLGHGVCREGDVSIDDDEGTLTGRRYGELPLIADTTGA